MVESIEIITAAIRPCLEPPTESVHPNSASPTEMDLKNLPISNGQPVWILEDLTPSGLEPQGRIESPIPSADNVIRRDNVRTHRGSVQMPAIHLAPVCPDFYPQQSAPKNSNKTGASSPTPTS